MIQYSILASAWIIGMADIKGTKSTAQKSTI